MCPRIKKKQNKTKPNPKPPNIITNPPTRQILLLQYSRTWKIPSYPEIFSLNKTPNKLFVVSQIPSRADNVLL